MKLMLPDYNYMFEGEIAEVKDGVLYIYRPGAFKEVMYKLTYLIFGETECCFCHKKLRTDILEIDEDKYFSQITLDHLIPQEFGGPTIPNNMRPTCSRCNNLKGNMYLDEFMEYCKFEMKNDKESKILKRKFKEELQLKQEKRKYGQIESIPKDWISDELIRTIYVNFWISEPLGVEYFKQEKFYKKYKRLPKLAIISQNRFLLDGFNTILLAKYNFSERINVIMLENVYYKGFPE